MDSTIYALVMSALIATIGLDAPVVLSFFLVAVQGALASGMRPTFSELFPAEMRASGQGFCLGGGRGFGSVVPATVGVLAALGPLGPEMGGCALDVLRGGLRGRFGAARDGRLGSAR